MKDGRRASLCRGLALQGQRGAPQRSLGSGTRSLKLLQEPRRPLHSFRGPWPQESAAARGQDLPGKDPGRRLAENIFRSWDLGHQEQNHCVYLVAGGRAVPPDVREEPGGALYVHSP